MKIKIPTRFKEIRKKHERWIPILFFALGFIFDTLMLRRIDELKTIIQQAVYLVISGALIGVELIESTRPKPEDTQAVRWYSKLWLHREAVLHFLLGTLLNSYTIFYFKSASAITSFVFIGMLISLLILNEFKRFGQSQTRVHVAFWSLCLISWLVSLAPIVLGFIGAVPFLAACGVSGIVFWGYSSWLTPRLNLKPGTASKELRIPFLTIQLIFVLLYFFRAIPPVPLSVAYMGIYHGVKKGDGTYDLSYNRPSWKFWQHGDQSFSARPGDSIYCFAQVFSPSRFKDDLQVRWLYHDPKRGWLPSDAIPMPITGGREEGFRGITKKSNYSPGHWRVQIETLDDREIGRISFNVEADDESGPREFKTDTR